MTIASRVANWLDPVPRTQRASTDPIPMAPAFNYGAGVGNQPDHETLLREDKGVFATGERAIANRVAGLTLEVVTAKRQPDGTMKDEVVDPTHPLVQLLANPHPNITHFQLFRLKTQWLTSVGEAAWLKVGNGLNVPAELHPIAPTNFRSVWRGGVVSHYVVKDGNGQDHVLEQDKVIHFYFPDPERFWGSEGSLGPSGTAADITKFAGQQTREHFRNDATPKTVLRAGESFLEPEHRRAFEDQWRASYHRLGGSARGLPAYIPHDAELIQLAIQSGSDVVPLLDHYRDDLLMAVGVPRSILGQVVSGDRSSAEVNQYVFDRYTVLPITRLDADALTVQLAHDFDPALKVRFAEFVSADKQFELAREAQDLTQKVVSINQVRAKRGDEEVSWGELPVGTLAETPYTGEGFGSLSDDDPDALGDRVRAKMAGKGLGEPVILSEEEGAEFDRQELERYHHSPLGRSHRNEALVRAEWERQVNREKQYLPGFTKRMRSVFNTQRDTVLERLRLQVPRARVVVEGLFSDTEWGELFTEVVEPFRKSIYVETVGSALETIGGSTNFVFTDVQAQILERQGAQLVKNVNEVTRARLSNHLKVATENGESLSQIEGRIRSVFKVRKGQASTIARTEVLKASQEAQITGFEVSGVVDGKVWQTSLESLDGDVRDSHAPVNGQTVALDAPFILGDGEAAMAPGVGVGGGSLSAGNSINCRCFVVPSFND